MNNDLYNVLFKLLSLSDESDIRMVCSSLLGYLVGKGKISVDELDEYIPVIKKDRQSFNCQSHVCIDTTRIYISS